MSKTHNPGAAAGEASLALRQNPVLLEENVPLSCSLIWRRQREFYTQRGAKAWTDDRVPSFITNNPFIAEIYARIVAGFVAETRVVLEAATRT